MWPGLKPAPLNPESSALTLHLPTVRETLWNASHATIPSKGGGRENHPKGEGERTIQRGRGREAICQVTSRYSDLSTLNMKLKTYLCILIDWSWCPCRAIMTSASSNTNILIFFGSRTLCLKIQSRRVPGVPNIMWSITFWPLETVKKRIVLFLM